MTVLQNAAKQMSISVGQLAHLRILSNVAADLQVKEHNDGVPASESIEEVESYAKVLGFSVIWPGLYPVFVKNGQQYHLPE
jgi:hypothetical protein